MANETNLSSQISTGKPQRTDQVSYNSQNAIICYYAINGYVGFECVEKFIAYHLRILFNTRLKNDAQLVNHYRRYS
ncbi:unnamed protein product, partial [Hymenolepis diminuta]